MKRDCFAYIAPFKCRALKKMECYDGRECPFYKNRNVVNISDDDLIDSRHGTERGLRKMARIKAGEEN